MSGSVASFLAKVSFDNLLKCSTVGDINKLKMEKESLCKKRCKCKNNSQFLCNPCSNINRKMCRVYHDNDPFEELVLRVAYEYMFNIVSYTQLNTGKWDERCSRDEGHHERIQRLQIRAKNKLRVCKWLCACK